ncbi:bile acid:sodium symporter [Gramella jeungdoensis]|uniref:Bile acid:sodium symporter n=1 Tax=Gramella jeungdoensis TaxID=708091 RepID=A0ABT0Z1T6_9FLAO|nr:bile acid:sodium symporter [Gramella jeungdoensis]MCM8569353.1 bile acid:sodium symporter [Gramella jeungdoensis]
MQQLADIIMPVSIAVIMFGIGLELKFGDFRRVFYYPKSILTGLSSQMILLPLIALALIYFWPMKPIYKIGVMLLAACPGGTASNLVTKMLKGRVALSVSLTAFNSFFILFTIPLIIELSYSIFGNESRSVDLSFWRTMKEVMSSVVLPVLGGIIIGNLLGDQQRERIHKPLKYILPLLLLVAVITVIFIDESSKDIHYLDYIPLFIPLILLNILTMLAGFLTSKKFNLKHESCFTIAIEMGLQNSVLALYIANQLLKDKDISLIAILYGSFSLISTFGIAYLLKRYLK